jgi:hypothetical protein
VADGKTELDAETVKQFLKELGELTRRTGIEICSCGCCASMWLQRCSGRGFYSHQDGRAIQWLPWSKKEGNHG